MLDGIIRYLSPAWAAKREHARRTLAYYEATRYSIQRKQRREPGSPDRSTVQSGQNLREQIRHAEQNNDLLNGALRILTNKTIGERGIGIEPQPRRTDGQIDRGLAGQLERMYTEWGERPEVTRQHDWPSASRMLARSWYRDGEVLVLFHQGRVFNLQHTSRFPFSLELIEADHLPLDYTTLGTPRIVAGVEKNTWGRPIWYHLYPDHPGEYHTLASRQSLRRVNANRIIHLKHITRIGQTRGISPLASTIVRFEDAKDYEESERVAAKIAAHMAGYIRKGTPDSYAPVYVDGKEEPREMRLKSGAIFDDLLPGEDIGTIDTKRPNDSLESFIRWQMRAASSGIGIASSSLTGDYEGSYSSRRQELVDKWPDYAVLSMELISQVFRPVYRRLVDLSVLAQELDIPAGIDMATISNALYIPPTMPWIDPYKEATAWLSLEQAGHATGPEIVRKRGQSPANVIEQEAAWRQAWRDAGEVVTADPAYQTPTENLDMAAINENA